MSTKAHSTFGELVASGAVQLGDGYRTKRNEHGHPGYRIIRVADVTDEGISLESPDFVADKFSKAIGAKAGQSGDILLTTKGTVGRVAVVPELHEPVVYSPQLCFFRVTDSKIIDPRYLRYWFGSPEFWSQAADRMNNTDMAAYINLADIRSLRISVPALAEQRAIAEVLGALDDKIAANTKLAATAEKLGSSVFLESISRPQTRRLVLNEVAKNIPGKYLAKDAYVNDGPYYVYGSNSIMGRHNEALTQGGFSVLAKIGSYCGNLRWSQRPAWVNNNASAIVPLPEVPPSVLRHALDRIDMAPHRAGTGQPYIRMESLFSSEVIFPMDEMCSAIAPVLDLLSELETRITDENITLAATRDALLPQLMSGKLRVKDAETVLAEAGV